MMLTVAGKKKKPMFPVRNSATSWICFALRHFTSSSPSRSSRLMTLAGKGKGSTCSMHWLTQ